MNTWVLLLTTICLNKADPTTTEYSKEYYNNHTQVMIRVEDLEKSNVILDSKRQKCYVSEVEWFELVKIEDKE